MKKLEVISYFGSAKQIAMELNLSQAAISQWGEIIPEKQALILERLTN